MSEEKTHRGISRRDFLKTGAVTAGVAATAGSLTALAAAPDASSVETVYRGVCRGNCAGGCALNVHVRDGRVVKTSYRELPDPRYNRICTKGLTHTFRIYNEHRLKTPMKRIGPRGEEASFEAITWDEAMDIVAREWKKITDQYGTGAMAMYWGAGQFGTANGCRYNDIWNRFANVTGTGLINRNVDIAHAHGFIMTLGWGATFTQNLPTDFVNSKVFMVWGANPVISQIQSMHFILEAKDAGAKLIVIDPVYNTLASKADIFVPISPGTDGALAMGMTKLIIDKGWMNEPFVKAYTVAPQLVKENGKYLRKSDLGELEEGEADGIMVMGPDGVPGIVGQVVDPAIRGQFVIEGIKVRTALETTIEAVAEYTLEKTSEITKVPVDQIVEITDLYANHGPSNIYTAFGMNHYVNGHYNFFDVAVLPCLTGNLGKKGAACGLNEVALYQGNPLTGKPAGSIGSPINVPNLKMDEIMETGMYGGVPTIIKGVMLCGCNPLTCATDRNRTIAWMEKMDFIVAVDMNFNESTQMADLILPVAHWFEEEDIFCLFACHPYMIYQDKCIDPLYDTKTDFEIACLLAKTLGFGQYFQMTDSEYLQDWLDTDTARGLGLTYDKLKEKGVLNMLPSEYVYAAGNKFPYGRLGIYRENAYPPEYNWGQATDDSHEHTPYWQYPNEVAPGTELRKKYPFSLLSDHSRFHTHSQWWEVDFLIELAGGTPVLRMNPDDAAEYGIEEGDIVKIFNDRGYCVMKVAMNAGLQRGMLSAPKGWEKRQYIDGHFSSLTSAKVADWCTNAAFNDVLVGIEKVEGSVK